MRLKLLLLMCLSLTGLLFAVNNLSNDTGETEINNTRDYTYETFTSNGFTLKYRTTYNNEIDVKLSAQTTGWLSVGFGGTNTGHNGANIIIGYVSNGTLQIRDHYGINAENHSSDTSLGGTDNIIQSSGTESGGVTTINFRIPLNSGDQYDKVLTVGGSMHIILAKGSADNFTSMHNGSAVGNIIIPQPQYPTTFDSFTVLVEPGSNPSMSLEWITSNENGLSGYNILRNDENNYETATIINPSLILAQNSSGPQTYNYIDHTAFNQIPYYYWIQYVTNDDYTNHSEVVPAISTSNENVTNSPLNNKLLNNYPNPFNPSTTISFEVANSSNINIEIFNSKGQRIKTLVNKSYVPGKYSVVWDGTNQNNDTCSSGIYYSKMISGDYSSIQKMLLIK